MRTLTPNAQALVALKTGNEPITVVSVDWQGKGLESYYAEREVLGIPGTLVSVADVDSIISSKTGTNAATTVTLSDLDGIIKGYLGTLDIQKRAVTIYQFFEGLTVADAIVIFRGQINTPIIWSEGERTVTFDVISRIEAQEVGFSPEEGQFDFVSPEFVGVAWPMCFGHPIHVPATKIRQQATGELLDRLCLVDPTIQLKMNNLFLAFMDQHYVFQFYNNMRNFAENSIPNGDDLLQNYTCVLKHLFITKREELDDLNSQIQNIRGTLPQVLDPNDADQQRKVERLREKIVELNEKQDYYNRLYSRKAELQQQVEKAEYWANVKKEAADKAQEALKKISDLERQYVALQQEACRQGQCSQDTVRMRGNFELTTDEDNPVLIDVFIEDLRWQGWYDGELFHITGGPLAKYKDVPLGEPDDPPFTEPCIDEEFERLKTFWIEDATYRLKNCYCLVKDKNGLPHIIKVIEQKDRRCTFELVEWSSETPGDIGLGSALMASTIPLPTYRLPTGLNDLGAAGPVAGLVDVSIAFQGDPTALDADVAAMLNVMLATGTGSTSPNDAIQQIIMQMADNNWNRIADRRDAFVVQQRQNRTLTPAQYEERLERFDRELEYWAKKFDKASVEELAFGEYANTFCNIGFVRARLNEPPPTLAEKEAARDARLTARKQGARPIGLTQEEYNYLLKMQKIREVEDGLDLLLYAPLGPRDIYTLIGDDIDEILEVAAIPLSHWFDYNIPWEEIPDSAEWSAGQGTTVYDSENFCSVWVANILPSQIRYVAAYRTVNDVKDLSVVPTRYYEKNEDMDIGNGMHITTIKLLQDLNRYGEGWEDQIFVTLWSSVGPNVVDIIQHLVETYTDDTVDPVSFNYVRDRFRLDGEELYPANFARFERMNVLEQISEIAWQARCFVYESNGVFYIKYLAEIPTPVATIAEVNVKATSLSLQLSATESLVTKFVGVWRPDYLPETPDYLVTLRHNVTKYGTFEEKHDFYIYNIQDLVIKSATFWMIRLCNAWKHVIFDVYLDNIHLETSDAITLDFLGEFFSDDAVIGEINQATYNKEQNTITLDVWVPIRNGELTVYPFAWPADLDADTSFPTSAEITLGFAGGKQQGVTGPITGCNDD